MDKSLLIKEILDDQSTEATVITRPRRFGKTLNLSMLHYFLAPEVNGQSTKGLFDGLKIVHWVMNICVIKVNIRLFSSPLKILKIMTLNTAYEICMMMVEIYKEHRYLLSQFKIE